MAAAALLTLFMSLLVSIGMHPETAAAVEWIAPVMGVVWAGAFVGRWGKSASFGTGLIVGLAWILAWLYLVGRFDTHLWQVEALPAVSWRYVLCWLLTPTLALIGGELANKPGKPGPLDGVSFHLLAPLVVLVTMLIYLPLIETSGRYEFEDGVKLNIYEPDKDGTTSRLFTFDFAANPNLRMGLYDCDSDDSRPFDDQNTSYFGTPAVSVYEKRGRDGFCVVNAGFFTWTKEHRIGSHVAPVVIDGKAHYDLLGGPDTWTFGWKTVNGKPRFRLLRGASFKRLDDLFDGAVGHVRPLIVDGKSLKLGPGAGVTGLKCSRTSIGWSPGSSKLYILVVRDPDSERASVAKWKVGERQVGGWDLSQVQQFWKKMGTKNAIALDGGDSTQLFYKSSKGSTSVGSGRLSITLGYLNNRPLRAWIPILPVRHSAAGVMNYICVDMQE